LASRQPGLRWPGDIQARPNEVETSNAYEGSNERNPVKPASGPDLARPKYLFVGLVLLLPGGLFSKRGLYRRLGDGIIDDCLLFFSTVYSGLRFIRRYLL
jgi:hypothetical protein